MLQTQHKSIKKVLTPDQENRAERIILQGFKGLRKAMLSDSIQEQKELIGTYGIQWNKFPVNLKATLLTLNIKKVYLEQAINEAINSGITPTDHQIDYDGKTLELVIVKGDYGITMYWEGYHFENHVGSEWVSVDGDNAIRVHAEDHLYETWREYADDFIMGNLHLTNIDDEELENLMS